MILMPSKKSVVIIDPFRRDRGVDAATNFLQWYQDEVQRRFSNEAYFEGLNTATWTVVVASTRADNSIFTPLQIDGYSCGPLCAMMAYYFIMYGELPTSLDFTCDSPHVKAMRLFMLFEIARLSSLPQRWTVEEMAFYDGNAQQVLANRDIRRQRAAAERASALLRPDFSLLNRELIVIDDDYDFNSDEAQKALLDDAQANSSKGTTAKVAASKGVDGARGQKSARMVD